MQPILLLAIVGIAGGAMSIGFLGNDISLTVQQLGVGDATLQTPITQADIEFSIDRVSGSVLVGSTTETQTHNVISACHITPNGTIDAGSHVFCKLTDENGNVVAEGQTELSHTVITDGMLWITIDPTDFAANKVQNVHDVVLVVQGP